MIETIFSGTMLLIAWVLSLCFAHRMGFNRGWMQACTKFRLAMTAQSGRAFAEKMAEKQRAMERKPPHHD